MNFFVHWADPKKERKNKGMPTQKVCWADISDDDDGMCEICEEIETTNRYCNVCVNKHLQLMSFLAPGRMTGLSESAKQRLYEVLCEENRKAVRSCEP